MSIIEFLTTWAVLTGVLALGYFGRRAIEIYNAPTTFKRIIDGPIRVGIFDGQYVMEGLDGNIHYAYPPFTLTLEE